MDMLFEVRYLKENPKEFEAWIDGNLMKTFPTKREAQKYLKDWRDLGCEP